MKRLSPIYFLLGLLGFCGGLTLSSCVTKVRNTHCKTVEGDATCAAYFGDERPYCTNNACDEESIPYDGCVVDQPTDECHYACGQQNDQQNVIDDDSCLEDMDDTSETETGDTETTETETETGPEPCVDSGDCDDPEAPFCDDVSGECVACDGVMDPDAACAEADPEVPLCIEGVCAQCTVDDDAVCGDLTPICDADTNTCIGCSEHEQCPDSGACNIAEGNCFDPTSIAHVDGDEPCNSGDGSEGSPYCSLNEALLGASDDPVLIVHEVVGDPLIYLESNTISFSAAVLAAPGESPVIRGSVSSALTVSSSGNLYIIEMSIDSTAGGHAGISVAGGQVWIEKSRIVNNSGGGIVVDGGGSLVLENSFVGGDVSDTPAIDVIDGTVDINYTTVIAGAFTSVALACVTGEASTVRNSIIISRSDDDELVCPDISITTSALEMPLGDNAELGPMDITWFSDDFAAGDFSLSGAHPLAIEAAATWLDGDPATDINGDARPTTDGMPDFAGADRIP